MFYSPTIFFPKRLLGRAIQIFALLLLSIMVIMFLSIIIGGIFGLVWKWIAGIFGYYGTAADALAELGDPNKLISWLKAGLDFIWQYIIKPIIDFLKGLVGG